MDDTCKYEVRQGMATVIGSKDGHVLARFQSGQPFISAATHSPDHVYHLQGVAQATPGAHLPAQLALIYEGSCTPTTLYVLPKP